MDEIRGSELIMMENGEQIEKNIKTKTIRFSIRLEVEKEHTILKFGVGCFGCKEDESSISPCVQKIFFFL